jgi:hypothetical protein
VLTRAFWVTNMPVSGVHTLKVRFHRTRTPSTGRVTRQVTEHVPCSLFKSMSADRVPCPPPVWCELGTVGDLINCACASFVCQIFLLTSQFSLVPATAFLKVSTTFFYGVAKGRSVEVNSGNNNNSNNNNNKKKKKKLKQKYCTLTVKIIVTCMLVNGFWNKCFIIFMTIIFLKSYALTYSRSAVIIALQTSVINLEMDALNILNKYIKLPSESPV